MNISVIVCSWNNPERLTLSLGAMGACRIPAGVEWELVLVNSGAGEASEATSAVARRYAGRLPIRHVEKARPGLSRAKNAGLRAATGSLLVFADDDVQPGREWLAVYWAAYQVRPAGHYFGGPIVSDYEGGRRAKSCCAWRGVRFAASTGVRSPGR